VIIPQPRPAGPPVSRQRRLSLGVRDDVLGELAQGLLDVLVIGGGITGCGVALECAARGLSTGLAESRDFGAGTSSRSTKLIHGGLRYLRHFEFDLVQEAAHERRRLGQLAPGLVSEFPFVLPFYGGPWSAAQLRVGLSTYDLMGGFGGHSRNVGISQDRLRTRFAPLLEGGARGAFQYFDALTDDARLTIQVAKTAASLGARLANYLPVQAIEPAAGHYRVIVRDSLGAEEYTLRARRVVLAAGVWLDELMGMIEPGWEPVIAPAKGIHLFIPRGALGPESAFTLSAPSDGRLIFAIPWYGRLMIGTTDTPYRGPLTDPLPDREGARYLIESIDARLPGLGIGQAPIIGAQAGVRPLIREEGADLEDTSRRERYLRGRSGIIAVGGGKLTTYRQIARRLADLVAAELGAGSSPPPLRADTGQIPVNRRIGEPSGPVLTSVADPGRAEMLRIAYGEGAGEIARIAARGHGRMMPGANLSEAEVRYAVAHEMAQTPEDLLARRRRIFLVEEGNGEAAAGPLAALLARLLGRSEDWSEEIARSYLDTVQAHRSAV
jgi:glycerol-3-phosphate dehydrogenase